MPTPRSRGEVHGQGDRCRGHIRGHASDPLALDDLLGGGELGPIGRAVLEPQRPPRNTFIRADVRDPTTPDLPLRRMATIVVDWRTAAS